LVTKLDCFCGLHPVVLWQISNYLLPSNITNLLIQYCMLHVWSSLIIFRY